jgi:hypothetical protein
MRPMLSDADDVRSDELRPNRLRERTAMLGEQLDKVNDAARRQIAGPVGETMSDGLKPGWLQRQFAAVEEDVKTWPEWMRREAGLTVGETMTSDEHNKLKSLVAELRDNNREVTATIVDAMLAENERLAKIININNDSTCQIAEKHKKAIRERDEARQRAERAEADAAECRVVLELAHAFILAVHDEFNFDTKTYSCQIREQVEAYLTTDDAGQTLLDELKLLRYACQMYVDYRGMFIADFQAKYDIQDDFTGHVLDTMRAALRKEPT